MARLDFLTPLIARRTPLYGTATPMRLRSSDRGVAKLLDRPITKIFDLNFEAHFNKIPTSESSPPHL
jgi:hypothetical protein